MTKDQSQPGSEPNAERWEAQTESIFGDAHDPWLNYEPKTPLGADFQEFCTGHCLPRHMAPYDWNLPWAVALTIAAEDMAQQVETKTIERCIAKLEKAFDAAVKDGQNLTASGISVAIQALKELLPTKNA